MHRALAPLWWEEIRQSTLVQVRRCQGSWWGRLGRGPAPWASPQMTLVPCGYDNRQGHTTKRDSCCAKEPLPGNSLEGKERAQEH